jgi:hypothetical protein
MMIPTSYDVGTLMQEQLATKLTENSAKAVACGREVEFLKIQKSTSLEKGCLSYVHVMI